MNGQCERFNHTLISMIGTLEAKDKQHWKEYLPTLVHLYNCTKNNATDFSPYYLMYGQKLRLPIDIKFSLASTQAEECSHNEFLAKLSAQLRNLATTSDDMTRKWGTPGFNLETSVW